MTEIEKKLLKTLDANKASSLTVLEKASTEYSVLGIKYNGFLEKIRSFYDTFIDSIKDEIRTHYDDALIESVLQADGVIAKDSTEAAKHIISKYTPVIELNGRFQERIYEVRNFNGLYVGIVTNPKLGGSICDIKYYHEGATRYDNKTELIYTGEDYRYANQVDIRK